VSSRPQAGTKLSPVMQQYLEIKASHEDSILFFRMGDFYEMFFEDAETAARLLDITLTSRNRNDPNPIPMCGIPYHSMRPYVARLLEAGQRVALCEQVELPGKGEKLARRAVTRVISPGTTLDEQSLAPEKSNYLVAVTVGEVGYGLAVTEFSTGEVRVTDLYDDLALSEELSALAPAEVVCETTATTGLEALFAAALPDALVLKEALDEDAAVRADASDDWAPCAARAHSLLLAYVARTQGGATGHLRAPEGYDRNGFVALDEATRRNLEILETTGGRAQGSLVSAIDQASTAMGKRLLRRWLIQPLADPTEIGRRLDAVESLFEDYSTRAALRDALALIGDLERLCGRLGAGTAGPRDVVRLADSLDAVAKVREILEQLAASGRRAGLLVDGITSVDPCPEVVAQIRETLQDEAPVATSKGGVIRDGFHGEVDRLREINRGGHGWLADLEASERIRTGISTLKIGFNKVFGYFIEVTHANTAKVPPEYVRKQTLTNAERYITDDLKKRESELLGAQERQISLETHLFSELVEDLTAVQGRLGILAAALAAVDVIAGLAERAHNGRYVRPEFHSGAELEILGGRHPVVETKQGERFVANDCVLGPESCSVMVITGPNMAGKSTYLRQTALLVLLAHCGSFVPADSARIPVVDRIFTRIGASDNLAAGQSTFMVEMAETSAILSNMTERSLVVLDEIGRGTSTFDGISIAWAVAEAMVAGNVKTLFATHYHELAGLSLEHRGVENFSVAVRRYRGEILFLYKIVEGPTSGSYGIEVARLAGVPESVIARARVLLDRFENGEGLPGMNESSQLALFAPRAKSAPAAPDAAIAIELRKELAELEPENLTPLDSLNFLAQLVARARHAQ
jgi:DNA mismatch repair protein MutS